MAEADLDAVNVEFEKLEVFPNECAFSNELNISGSFKSSRNFKAKWKITYEVDSAYTQHVIVLGDCEYAEISNNQSNSLEFKIDKIDISDINDSTLFNTGLLKLQLIDAKNNEIISVNIVTQITKDDNKFIRTFFNPLE